MDGIVFDEDYVLRIKSVVDRVEQSPLLDLANGLPEFNSREPQPVYFRNNSGSTIPAYGCMFATGAELVENRPVIVVEKPDDRATPVILFNGPREIRDGGRGVAQQADAITFRCLHSGTAPTNGDELGPTDDEWYLSEVAGPFRAIGEINATTDEMLITSKGDSSTVDETWIFGLGGASLTYQEIISDTRSPVAVGFTTPSSTDGLVRRGVDICEIATHSNTSGYTEMGAECVEFNKVGVYACSCDFIFSPTGPLVDYNGGAQRFHMEWHPEGDLTLGTVYQAFQTSVSDTADSIDQACGSMTFIVNVTGLSTTPYLWPKIYSLAVNGGATLFDYKGTSLHRFGLHIKYIGVESDFDPGMGV